MLAPEMALKFTAQAIIHAKEAMPKYAGDKGVQEWELKKSVDSLTVLDRNLKKWERECNY